MGILTFLFAYILGGLTALPLVLAIAFAVALWTSVPVGDVDPAKRKKQALAQDFEEKEREEEKQREKDSGKMPPTQLPKPRKGWLTVRRAFDDVENALFDGSYMDIMRSILDSRSKDPKKSRPRDAYFAVLKGSVLFLYEDEAMSDCHAALEMSRHAVDIYPPGLLDGELFTKRNAIRLSPNDLTPSPGLPHLSKEMKLSDEKDVQEAVSMTKSPEAAHKAADKVKEANQLAREEAFDFSTPWFLFVRSVAEMEDWYHALVHASKHPASTTPLEPLEPVFSTEHMQYLVSHLDTQPDPIPMRWLNALIGRLFFSVYKTAAMEDYIIGRLMKKLAKVKKPSFLADIVVKEVSVGSTAPTLYKPMLKELTKEGDAAVEIGVHYKGEIRITVETTAMINLGARFRSYEVKLVLAIVLRELEGNVLVKMKPAPSNRIWYAFTKMPRMELAVEPVVSDRQITWGMILKTIEGRLKEIILESVVLPNYDDIAFFDTSAFGHRGGIYADAIRQSLRPKDTSVPTPVVQQTQSTGVVETLSRNDSTENLKMPGHYSTSALPLTTEPLEAVPAKSPNSSVLSLPTLPTESNLEPDPQPTTGTTTPTVANVLVEPPSPAPETASQRGRLVSTASAGSDLDSLKRPRDPSVSASSRGSMEGEADQGLNLPSRKSTTRSSPSPAPSTASHSASQSVDTSSTQQVNPIATSSTFSSNTSTGTRPNGSFIENLRSRAAAAASAAEASNPKAVAQARETIQKWGAQWAGLKKNLAENRESRSNSVSSTPSTSTLGLSVPSTSPPSSASISKGFDDMRRVVAERRQREERERVISDVGRVAPLEVPAADKSRRQSAGPVLASKFNAEVYPSTTSSDQILPSTSPTKTRVARSDSLGNARTLDMDENMGSRYNGPPTPKTAPIVVETRFDASPASTSPSQKPQPIVSQPAYGAMSMTIPGIHAKNRNEVMSMGSAPIEPAPVPAKEEVTATSSRLQGIGNIYRLLKKTSGEPLKAPEVTPTDIPDQTSTVETTIQPDISTTTPTTTATTRNGESRRTSMEAVNSNSPASVALLSLVARDDLARKKSLTRGRTGSVTDHQRSDSSLSSSPPASGFGPPSTVLSSEPEPLELSSR